jgi:hypothetical protein
LRGRCENSIKNETSKFELDPDLLPFTNDQSHHEFLIATLQQHTHEIFVNSLASFSNERESSALAWLFLSKSTASLPERMQSAKDEPLRE